VARPNDPLDSNDIRRLEELTLNAWPGLREVVRDGWVARLANGFTGRANSVYPLYDGALDAGAKIEFFERLYARHGLPTTFKLTNASRPTGLDTLLAARGYRESRRASVQVSSIAESLQTSHGANAATVESKNSPWEQWLQAVVRFRSFSDAEATSLRAILANIALPSRYVCVIDSGVGVAWGVGVLEGNWVGLYDIVTREDRRGRGHGQQVVRSLLAWARDNGASNAYLQVMIDNVPAQSLYGKLGFREAYQYAYRSKRT
jgi:GNAT superfamily N-acetyltransferase